MISTAVRARRAEPDGAAASRLPVVFFTLVVIGIPAAFLVVGGLIGTHLDTRTSFVGTIAVFMLLLAGCPVTVFALSRAVLRSRGRVHGEPALRVRRPSLHQMLPPPVLAPPKAAAVRLGVGHRAAAVAVLAIMFAMSLAMWTAVPVAWLWIGSQLASTTRPELEPYLVIIGGIPLTMYALVRALYRLDTLYGRITCRQAGRTAQTAWLKSLSAERQRRPTTTADAVMCTAVLVAALCLLAYFVVFARYHSFIDWYLD